MSWRDDYTYEDIRALGIRGDELEEALAKVVEEVVTHAGARAHEVLTSKAIVDAIALLSRMKLASTREMLARIGVA